MTKLTFLLTVLLCGLYGAELSASCRLVAVTHPTLTDVTEIGAEPVVGHSNNGVLVQRTQDQRLRLTDTEGRGRNLLLAYEGERIQNQAISPKGSFLVVVTNKAVRLVDTKLGTAYGNLDVKADGYSKIKWSPDGTSVAILGIDRKQIAVYSAPGDRKQEIKRGYFAREFTEFSWSPEDDFIAAIDGSRHVDVYAIEFKPEVSQAIHSDISFSHPRGQQALDIQWPDKRITKIGNGVYTQWDGHNNRGIFYADKEPFISFRLHEDDLAHLYLYDSIRKTDILKIPRQESTFSYFFVDQRKRLVVVWGSGSVRKYTLNLDEQKAVTGWYQAIPEKAWYGDGIFNGRR
jgi:WD40 repeat protein